MKKTLITFLTAGLLITGLKAQTIQEGMNHLYADRFKSAIGVFEKMLAANPNNMEATYWLGQTYFDMDNNTAARQLYEKALATNGSAPLILVGLGHADLHDNKTADARQKFEAAITAATTKKGVDPIVLTAIGRANVDAKAGDFNYAIEKLSAAADKGDKNTETLLQLGNAYRKARPGEGGGAAFTNYKKALEVDPKFAVADLRLAKLFESQKNWELVLEYLNDAVKRDPKFAPAYYELFYYYFYRTKYAEAEGQLASYIANSDDGWEKQYLEAQLNWAKKDFASAITKAEGIVNMNGDKTKPKIYKLLADANYQKGDFAKAKTYIDKYFAKEKVEDQIAKDYSLLADILNKNGGTPTDIYNAYMKGADLDTVLTSKIDFLKAGAVILKGLKARELEGNVIEKVIALKPKPTINDYFDLTLARYFTPDYLKSREKAITMIEKFPDQPYGYEWAFNSSLALATDTLKAEASRDSIKTAMTAPDATKMFDFSKADTAKYRKQYLSAVRFLAQYSYNIAKDKEKSIEYFTKWLEVDPANAAAINGYIEQIKKMQARPTTPPKGNAPPAKPSVSNKKTTTTTVSKKAVVKK